MRRLSILQAARVVGIDPSNARAMLPRLTRTLNSELGGQSDLGGPARDDVGTRRSWSPGEVVAMAVMRALDAHDVNPGRWATGAAHAGDAHERGLCPVYLVTAGGPEYAVVLDSDGAERAVIEFVRRLSAAGPAVRVVPLAPIVEHVCDVLDARRPA
jgi:hypothetical protein